MAEKKYQLAVTAGPNYTDQKQIAVNTEQFTHVSSDLCSADIVVRVRNYHGLPKDSPETSPYFANPLHQHDLYSLSFTFTPKDDINAHDLVFGNDFDHPIKDKLPPGFQQAFNLVKWFIDPGLYGDVYADEPYLYGPLLSSINSFRIGPSDDREQEKIEETRANQEVVIVEEGADADGEDERRDYGIPHDAAARKKYFLNEQHLKDFTFEKNRQYLNDFFNPYLDFNDFALKLPGFSVIPGVTIPVISYWDGQPLRYVLKNRATNEPLFVVMFSLQPVEGQQEASKNAEKDDKPTTQDDDVD